MKRLGGRRPRAWGAGLALWAAAVSGCESDERMDLLVDLRTDVVAGVEFVRVRVERFEQVPEPGEVVSSVNVRERSAQVGEPFVSGVRAAVFENVKPGSHVVRARLVDRQNAIVLERIAILMVRRTSVFTLVMTRDCRGVQCPGAADDPSLIACVAGRCVRPECTLEQQEFCPAFSCEADVNCSAPASCAHAFCTTEGVCLRATDHTQCPAGQWCNPEVGCMDLDLDGSDGGVDGSVGADGSPDASDCTADGGCPPADIPWGEWTAQLSLPDCPVAPELLVNTPTMELDGGTGITDPAQAGALLSLHEALYIASNRPGPDTILFDATVFPVDDPPLLSIDGTGVLPLQVGTCIDGRGRGVIITGGQPADRRWEIGNGSYQVGLTFLSVSGPQGVPGGRVAGCRYDTDGRSAIASTGSNETLRASRAAIIGPHNVFASKPIGIDGGGSTIVGNWFGLDPVTRVSFDLTNALFLTDLGTPRGLIQFRGNTVYRGVTAVVAATQSPIAVENNFYGIDPAGRVLEGSVGFRWLGPGQVVFGPGNTVSGVNGVAVSYSGNSGLLGAESLQITRNAIFGNAARMDVRTTPAPPAPPTITAASATAANGTCPVSGTLELFSDRADQGEHFVAAVTCDSVAGWSYSGSIPTGRNLTATLTAAANTSDFSAPFAVP